MAIIGHVCQDVLIAFVWDYKLNGYSGSWKLALLSTSYSSRPRRHGVLSLHLGGRGHWLIGTNDIQGILVFFGWRHNSDCNSIGVMKGMSNATNES